MKKRIIALLCVMLMAASILTACSGGNNGGIDDDKINIVCTIFPQYDWVRSIIGEDSDNIELTLLMDNGVDLHSYQPSADDIANIAACDIFIYVGGESDAWVEDALTMSINKDMKVINMMDVLGSNVKEEEIVEGMQTEEHEEEHEDEEELEYDEHIWLSVKNAKVISQSIEEAIAEADSANADKYKTNYDSYAAKLDELDSEYADAVNNATYKTVLFGDRFPFRYLVDDYGIEYYAAFVGCSAETEASFETIVFLAGKLNDLKLPAVIVIEGSEHKIAETIISNSDSKDQDILVMNSLQSVTSTDVDNGTTYLSIMEDNLNVLKQALN